MSKVRIVIGTDVVEIEDGNRSAEELAAIAGRTLKENQSYERPRLEMGFGSQQISRSSDDRVQGSSYWTYETEKAQGGVN